MPIGKAYDKLTGILGANATADDHANHAEALILAALKRGDERTRQRFAEEIAKAGDSARDKLLAVFGRLESWFSEPAFNGCMFQKAAADYPDAQDPIHAMAAEHKRLLRVFLEGLAREAGAPDPAELAAQLQLLIDGAISQAQICGGSEAAVEARRAAVILIATAVPRAESS